MRCTKCGAQISDTARFCSFCGGAVSAPVEPAVSAEPTAAADYPAQNGPAYQQMPDTQTAAQTEPRSKSVVLIFIAAALTTLLLVAGVVGAVCCVDCGDKEPADGNVVPDFSEPADTAAPVEFHNQLEIPEKGEDIAVFETTAGTFMVRLFPNNAPKTVENFVNLIYSGYYDGITFHRVIDDFMIQAGDPTGTGAGGSTFTGKPLKDEYDSGLYHFRYAMSMANTGMPNSGTSQFFIVQSDKVFAGMDENGEITEFTTDQLIDLLGYSEGVALYYEFFGGTPTLDAQARKGSGVPAHTVFGQVFEGIEVIDAIAAVDTDENDRPLEDVVIIRAYIDTFRGERVSVSDAW